MKLTAEFLESKNACQEGIDWFKNQKETDLVKLIKLAIKKKEHLDWANWIIVRCMTYKQYVSYAVFTVEQVIEIYEKRYPDDKRPRNAIEAAKKCIDNPSKENKTDAAAYVDAAAAAVKIKVLKYGIKLITELEGEE